MMPNISVYILVILLVYISTILGFLTNLNQSLSATNALTDNHYITIIDFLAEEKQARRQLEQFATQLQHELLTVKQEVQSLKRQNDSCKTKDLLIAENKTVVLRNELMEIKNQSSILNFQLIDLKENYSDLYNNYTQLQLVHTDLNHNYSQLQLASFNIQSELILQRNDSMALDADLTSLFYTYTGEKLNNVTTLQDGVSALNREMRNALSQINSLVRNTEIRKQDFLALISENNNMKSKLTLLESENEVLKNETASSFSAISEIGNRCILKQVAVYACGNSDARYSRDEVIKFNTGKTVIGFGSSSQFYSSGVFRTENAGLYLVSSTIMSVTSQSHYHIYKNNAEIAYVYIGDACGSSSSFTGSMVVAVQLNVGDTVYVKTAVSMGVHGIASCLTLTKIK